MILQLLATGFFPFCFFCFCPLDDPQTSTEIGSKTMKNNDSRNIAYIHIVYKLNLIFTYTV